MSTSKRGPSMWCFYYFYFEMCFAPPQRRALFHVSTSKSGPNVRCFLHFDFQMCFAPQQHAILHLSPSQMAPHPPPEPQIIGKTQFCDFSTFSRTCIFFLLALFFDILSSSLLDSDSSHLCFPTDHIVGNLTSKLPSVMLYFCIFINFLCTCSTKQRKRPVTPQQAACSLIVSAVEPSMWSGQEQPARTRHSA